MRKFILPAIISAVSILCFAETSVDPCSMISSEDLAKSFGEIKEGPKPKEGLMKEKQCEWTNMSGAWLSIAVYDSEKWDLKKGSANDPTEIKGLGDEAFSDKRGTDAELYIRKGKLILEVRTSSGAQNARQAADLALKKL